MARLILAALVLGCAVLLSPSLAVDPLELKEAVLGVATDVKPINPDILPTCPPMGCTLRKTKLEEVNGCTPLCPVYKTSCSGTCRSSYGYSPGSKNELSERCECCKPRSTKTVTTALSCPADYRMSATCDNFMKVYFDGVLQPPTPPGTENNWGQTSFFTVPGDTEVVAIECEDVGSVGGILASFSNGVITDRNWACSAKYFTDWNTVGFGPTSPSWNPAYEIAPNQAGTANWGLNSDISNPNALWIWTTEGAWHGQDRHVYCRRHMNPDISYTKFVYTEIEGCDCKPCKSDLSPVELPVDSDIKG